MSGTDWSRMFVTWLEAPCITSRSSRFLSLEKPLSSSRTASASSPGSFMSSIVERKKNPQPFHLTVTKPPPACHPQRDWYPAPSGQQYSTFFAVIRAALAITIDFPCWVCSLSRLLMSSCLQHCIWSSKDPQSGSPVLACSLSHSQSRRGLHRA